MKKVLVFGALGNMGERVVQAVADDEEMELVGAVDPAVESLKGGDAPVLPGGVAVSAGPEGLEDKDPVVMIDFTDAASAVENIRWSLDHGIHCVVGTTAISDEDIDHIKQRCSESGANVLIAPNFSIGAVLMMEFAESAAPFFERCEIIELHHRGKLDAPSGTAMMTARRVSNNIIGSSSGESTRELLKGSRGGEVGSVRVHSIRMDGLIAHQEVIFGGRGQLLTIRHDATDRSCFMDGVLLAVKRVEELGGLTIGLEPVLDI